MTITKTFIDVLLELPADTTLRTFLQANGLPFPDDLSWESAPETSSALVAALRAWPDVPARDRLIGKLMTSVQLAEPSGRRAMFQVAADTITAFMAMVNCTSDMHRSFWLYVHQPHLFEQACDLDYLERHRSRAQQFNLGVRRRPDTGDAAVAALRQAIAGFYQRELQCGDASTAYLVEHRRGYFLLTVHVKDLAALRLEFDGPTLTRRVGHPNIHMVLEYAVATGVARTMVAGGQKYHRMLIDAFAEHLLGGQVDSIRVKRQALDLSPLRFGFDLPRAADDGVAASQVKSLTLINPEETLQLKFTAMSNAGRRDVTDLLAANFSEGMQARLNEGWHVKAATLNLYYAIRVGRMRSKVVTIELTSDGGLNLHKFDAKLQSEIESYLVELGVMPVGQSLHVQTSPDPDTLASDPSPATASDDGA
jgi:hypothetical protein